MFTNSNNFIIKTLLIILVFVFDYFIYNNLKILLNFHSFFINIILINISYTLLISKRLNYIVYNTKKKTRYIDYKKNIIICVILFTIFYIFLVIYFFWIKELITSNILLTKVIRYIYNFFYFFLKTNIKLLFIFYI